MDLSLQKCVPMHRPGGERSPGDVRFLGQIVPSHSSRRMSEAGHPSPELNVDRIELGSLLSFKFLLIVFHKSRTKV